MSSILTNSSAMVALQTLKGINSSLAKTQSEISTGKSVGSAKDNAAIWAISKTMESDVKGFGAIADNIALGQSTVAVAQKASETVTDLLTQMKEKITSAQNANTADKATIQTDIDALVSQIGSVVSSAQFNGVNLVNGGSGTSVLSELNRDASGNVTSNSITVAAQDLSFGAYSGLAIFTGSDGASADADTASISLDKDDTTGVALVLDDAVSLAEGDTISVTLGDQTVSYTLSADDAAQTAAARNDLVAAGLKAAIDDLGISNLQVDFAANDGTDDTTLTFKSDGTDLASDLSIVSQYNNAGAGGLGAAASINVSSDAAGALTKIDTLIDTATAAAAAFGSVANRLETQASFVSKLSDAMTQGIGSLVDADMEEASARLQALQTQQQLGIQALSIANQQPQNILSLFK